MPDALNRELAGFVELYRDGRVLEIRMVKPKVNAICPRLSWALERAALYLQDSPELQVGLLTSGCDKAFSAGLDFNDATGERSAGDDRRPVEGGFGGITTLWALKKPLIAVVSAPAIGGGTGTGAGLRYHRDGRGYDRATAGIAARIDPGWRWIAAPASPHPLSRRDSNDLDGRADDGGRGASLGLAAPPCAQVGTAGACRSDRTAHDPGCAARAAGAERGDARRRFHAGPRGDDSAPRAAPDLEVYGRMWASDDAIEGQRAFLERRPPKWSGT